jgi:hypothetical protein
MRRTYPVLGIAIAAASASGCAAAAVRGGPQAAGSARSVVQVDRRDPFRLTATTRVCVEAALDPSVSRRIEASDESVTARALTFMITGLVADRFRALGLSPYLGTPERPRVVPYISDIADRSCVEQPGNVLVRLNVGADATGRGYRITIAASQGRQRYSSAIERARILMIPGETRHMIPRDGDTLPGTATPFWDVTRDSYRLSRRLTEHIFARTRL